MDILNGLIKLLVTFAVMIVVLSWGITGYFAMTQYVPTKEECGDGYVVVSGVSVLGWPGRWVCVPGKEPTRVNP